MRENVTYFVIGLMSLAVAVVVSGITYSAAGGNFIYITMAFLIAFLVSAVLFKLVFKDFTELVTDILYAVAGGSSDSDNDKERTKDGSGYKGEKNTINAAGNYKEVEHRIGEKEEEEAEKNPDFYRIADIPEDMELTFEEKAILKMIYKKSLKGSDILHRIPRTANIYVYKDALAHLEERNVITKDSEELYSIVLSDSNRES